MGAHKNNVVCCTDVRLMDDGFWIHFLHADLAHDGMNGSVERISLGSLWQSLKITSIVWRALVYPTRNANVIRLSVQSAVLSWLQAPCSITDASYMGLLKESVLALSGNLSGLL